MLGEEVAGGLCSIGISAGLSSQRYFLDDTLHYVFSIDIVSLEQDNPYFACNTTFQTQCLA